MPEGRSQLPNSTGQTSGMDSLSQPGRSFQSIATKRLRFSEPSPVLGNAGAVIAGTVGMLSATGGSPLGAATGAVPGAGKGSLLAQATSNNARLQVASDRHKLTMGLGAEITVATELGYTHMLLILLEALGAGLILVLIVWWTMFSGRRKGERDDAE